MNQLLTLDQLKRAMPRLKRQPDEAELYIEPLNVALNEFEINTPVRIACFLAQIGHESGELLYWEEIWGPTKQQKKYDPPHGLAERLGNTHVGDGRRYKGRGPIQLTGRANYRRVGEKLDVDLEDDPGLVAKPRWGFQVAGVFWSENGCNELADATAKGGLEAFSNLTRRINGGLTGLDDRVKRWQLAKQVFNLV